MFVNNLIDQIDAFFIFLSSISDIEFLNRLVFAGTGNGYLVVNIIWTEFPNMSSFTHQKKMCIMKVEFAIKHRAHTVIVELSPTSRTESNCCVLYRALSMAVYTPQCLESWSKYIVRCSWTEGLLAQHHPIRMQSLKCSSHTTDALSSDYQRP